MMKKLAAASLTIAVLASTAVMFAPASFGADPELPHTSGNQSKAEEAAENAEVAGMANGRWHRPPADASINKFVVALASVR
jgi:hypothetical protein